MNAPLTRYVTLAFAGGIFGAVSTASNAGVFSNDFYIFPAAPKYMEQVVLRIDHSNYNLFYGGRVSMEGNRIVVRAPLIVDITSPGNHDITLGAFPAGSYSVDIHTDTPTGPSTLLATRSFTVADQLPQPPAEGPQLPVVNYTAVWWNPARSGSAMTITQQSDGLLIATWSVHDVSGKPTWYTLEPGSWVSETTFSGPIHETHGSHFGGTYDPSKLQQTAVGNGTLTFRQFDNGRFAFSISGISGSQDITRFTF